MNQFQQKGLLGAVGLISILVSFAFSEKIEITIFKYFGVIAIILAVILLAFDKLLWKIPFIYPWFVSAPNLNGNWEGNGNEKLEKVEEDNSLTLTNSKLVASQIIVTQSYSDIELEIRWDDGTRSVLIESFPYAAHGKSTKNVTFSGIYNYYSSEDALPESRNVMLHIVVEKPASEKSKPSNFKISYWAQDIRGVINVTKNT